MGMMDGTYDFNSGQMDTGTQDTPQQNYSENYSNIGSTDVNPIATGGDYGSGYQQISDSVSSILSSLNDTPGQYSTGNYNDIGTQTGLVGAAGPNSADSERVASSGGITSMIKGWLQKINDPSNKMSVAIGSELVKGILTAPLQHATMQYQKSMARAAEMNANANSLTATTNANIANQKMKNASGIKDTNYGTSQGHGLVYTDLLAQRRARSGATT